MNREEIRQLFADTETIQNKYGKILRDEDRERIEHFRERYELALLSGNKTSKFGCHYNICEWSNDDTTVGADTCICFYADRHIADIRNILKWYTDNTQVNLGNKKKSL